MPSVPVIRALEVAPETLTVRWGDGRVDEFPSMWLRDNLAEERDPHSGQRLVDITDLPEAPRLAGAEVASDALQVKWQDRTAPGRFSLAWLAAHAPGHSRLRAPAPRPWLEGSARAAERDFAWLSLATLRSESAQRLGWLNRLLQDGLAFLREVPAREGALLETMPLVGQVLETNYGRHFDVRSVPQPENLAYSDLGLGLHTDNPYREPVPGYQALHALLVSNEGGASLFADGFALAEHLRATDPPAFACLSSTAVPFLYRSADAELYAERPLIQLDVRGAVSAVHYNNRSIAPLPFAGEEARAFYRAYRRFAALLREPRWQLRTHLQQGVVVLFDNQRILHGRTAFSSARAPRHLQGCYLSRDSVRSSAALLARQLGGSA